MSTLTIERLLDTLQFFAFLAFELTALFLLISFLIGVIMDVMPAKRIQTILGSQGGRGYLSAGLLGALTPFCSCSTIPMLSGLLKARAGFGPTITFLFTSPLLNPIIIGLFWVTFGLKVTAIYFAIALVTSVIAGFVLEKMGFERHVRREVVEGGAASGCGSTTSSCGTQTSSAAPASCGTSTESSCGTGTPSSASSCGTDTGSSCGGSKPAGRWAKIWAETWKQFRKIFPLLMLGVAIGSLTYGFVPEDLIVQYAGDDNPLAIAIAAVIGVPLYIRAEAMIPLAAALELKGMGMGALMALIIGSAGASITEVILLKTLFRRPMIIAFLTVIFTMAFSAGMLFSVL
ncbi:permease [Ferrimonas pelagia]|uniref:Permease n=1 Tax=Ferrimonas pelagia TaxID=1177826 RepID=A0ABP9E9A2_9GAMM